MSNCNLDFIKNQCNSKNDYNCQRKCNIHKLEQLYQTELANYNKEYTNYLNLKYSKSSDKAQHKALAEWKIKPRVIRLNRILNTILADLRRNIDHTHSLIKSQESDIESKNNSIYLRNKQLTNQFSKIENQSGEMISKEQQIESGLERNLNRRNSMILFISLNILLICLLVYFFSK